MSYDIATKCIHLEKDHQTNPYGAVSFPIFQTVDAMKQTARAARLSCGSISDLYRALRSLPSLHL